MKKQILKTIFAGFCILLMNGIATAQIPAVPTLSFTAPDTVTVGQSFFISNTSTAIPNGTVFTWEIESQTDRQFQAKDTLISIVTSSITPISYAYLHEGAFKITLNATGINEFQKTIWVKGLINSSCTQYLQNYNYVDCEYVANGSFEDYTALATGTYSPSIQNFCPWRFNPWIYTLGSADQYHQNNNAQILSVPANGVGYQQAATGGGYAGFLTYTSGGSREYFFANLKEPLQPGEQYDVKFKVSLAEGSSHATKVSACLVNSPSQTTQNFPGTQQNNIITINPNRCITSNVVTDKNGWTEVSGIFNAANALPENTIIIGHFNFTGQTPAVTPVTANPAYPALTQQLGTAAYYYIDDVSVKQVGFCHCPADKSFGTDLNSVTYTSQLNMSPGQSASIIGNLVVNSPVFTMNNLNLKFAPGSKLTVPAGTKLEIVQGSVLEACTEMWEGIFAPGELFLFQGTVRDAKSALNFTNTSKWNVQMSVLENNRRHMLVNNTLPASGFTSSYFKDNILRCNPAQMKAPFAGLYTYNAIELYNIREIFIGREGPVADRNEISDAYRGIYAERVEFLRVQNNHFENIKCHNPAGLVCGKGTDLNVAILVNARKITEPHSRLFAGIQSNPFAKNTFNNCTGGIYVLGNVSSHIHLNHMTNIRDYGIHSTGNYFAENVFFAVQNTIHQAKSGIYLYDLRNRPAFIFGNIVKKLTDFNTVPTYGIRIENPLASSQPYAVFVNANEVWQYRFGIHLSQITTPQVMNNLVNTHAHITSYPEGIRVNYCPKAHIAENNIYEYGAGIGQSMGIRVEYSSNASTLCNNIYSNQISMFFGGNQPGSTVGANYMQNGKQGIFLNFGNIGRQGENNVPHLNAWIGNTWSAHFVTSQSGTGGLWSRFQLKWPGTIFYPLNLTSQIIDNAWPIQALVYSPQGAIPAFVTNCRGNLDDQAGMVEELYADSLISDSLEFRNEAKWAYDYQLYRNIKEDTTGMLDAALYQYKAALEQTTFGRLEQAKDSAINTRYTEALVTLNTINDTLEIESKLKTVLGFYFEKNNQTDSTIELSEAEIQVLTEMAIECPYKYGEAVYTARNILYGANSDTLYVNSCEESYLLLPKTLKVEESTTEEEKEHFVIYPNPSAGEFALVFETVEEAEKTNAVITDLYGRKMGEFNAFRGSNMILIPADALPKGVYFCTVYEDGVMIKTKQIQKL